MELKRNGWCYNMRGIDVIANIMPDEPGILAGRCPDSPDIDQWAIRAGSGG